MRYGRATAVDDVSFRCEPGTVTGFVGPNGAGKSTTLRILTGLTPPSTGTATVHGVGYRELPNPGRDVGVLLDASAFHRGRTGRETLWASAAVIGVPRERAAQLLDLVGLAGAARRRVGGYSLGMRQRLGIAHALLGDPSVLVLDEPATGLDPEGIAWLRTLLRDVASRGGTVLLSSHLLREVEAVADHLVVLARGRVVADRSRAELHAGAGLVVRALDGPALGAALDRAGLAVSARPDGALRVAGDPATVGRVALEAGVVLTELRADDGGLEALFLSLTGAPLAEAAR